MQASTCVRVLTLGIFAHHNEVDVGWRLAGQRTGRTGQKLDGANAGKLLKILAYGQDERAQRNMVRNAVGVPHGTEVDGVIGLQCLQGIVRHHTAVFVVVVAAPWKSLEGKLQARYHLLRRAEHLESFRHDFLTDAIARDHRNFVSSHEFSLSSL